MKRPLDPESAPPALEAPAGIAVETPAVRVLRERQISWRLRPSEEVSGKLRVVLPDQTLEKTIASVRGPWYLSDRRVSSLLDLFWHPGEKRLPEGAVDWIEVRYPAAAVRCLGLEFHWLAWFLSISMITASLFRRRFRVTL